MANMKCGQRFLPQRPIRFWTAEENWGWIVFIALGAGISTLVPLNVNTASELTKSDVPTNMPSGIRTLIEDTFSPIVETKADAAKKLGKEGDLAAPAIPFLIRLLSDDGRVVRPGRIRTVSDEAELALLLIGKPATEPCIAAIKQASGLSRRRLIFILGSLRQPQAVDVLLPMFKDPDPEVRRAVMSSVLGSRDSRLVPPVIGALNDDNADVRRMAVGFLESFREPRVVDALIAALKDPDWVVRLGAANSLRMQRSVASVPSLLHTVQNSTENMAVRGAAAAALGGTGETVAVRLLSEMATNVREQEELRRWAAVGLGESGRRDVSETLLTLANDVRELPSVRVACVGAVARLDGIRAIPLFMRLIKTDDEQAPVRLEAALRVVAITDGAVDDVAVVNALEPYYDRKATGTGLEYRWKLLGESLEKVAEHGKSQLVREAASEKLRQRHDAPTVDSRKEGGHKPGLDRPSSTEQ